MTKSRFLWSVSAVTALLGALLAVGTSAASAQQEQSIVLPAVIDSTVSGSSIDPSIADIPGPASDNTVGCSYGPSTITPITQCWVSLIDMTIPIELIGAQVSSASLKLTPSFPSLQGSSTLKLAAVAEPYGPQTVTWNSQPDLLSATVRPLPAPSSFLPTFIDVTDIVQAWADGTYEPWGFVLYEDSIIHPGFVSFSQVGFYSIETAPDAASRPELWITYTPAFQCGTPPDPGAPAVLNTGDTLIVGWQATDLGFGCPAVTETTFNWRSESTGAIFQVILPPGSTTFELVLGGIPSPTPGDSHQFRVRHRYSDGSVTAWAPWSAPIQLGEDPDGDGDPPVLLCAGRLVTVDIGAGERPTEGDDVILGTNGPDRIDGLGGRDIICALAGDDIIDGGDELDRIYGHAGNDLIMGSAGRDRIWGGDGNDTIDGGTNRDVIVGGRGRDVIRGEGGRDRINGSVGNDQISGGGGNDQLKGGRGIDIANGGNGTDSCIDFEVVRKCE